MSDAPSLDALVLANVAAALENTRRWPAGVWIDRPRLYVPGRAWLYKEVRSIDTGGSGLVEVKRRIAIEGCFPFTMREGGPSDLEQVGDAVLAELESALYADPSRGLEDADTAILADDVDELVRKDGKAGTPLGRATMIIEVTYSRGWGDPFGRGATRR